MMWGYSGPMMWGMGILMWIVPLGLVGLLFWAFSRSSRPVDHINGDAAHSPMGGDPALAILRQRLAKGEISEEEYERLKERLSK
ncbi:MAG: SHOCT domain-containing protein [Chloroflexota bacterium]